MEPGGVNQWYFKPRLFDLTELKVWITKVYDICCKDIEKIRVCGKDSILLFFKISIYWVEQVIGATQEKYYVYRPYSEHGHELSNN